MLTNLLFTVGALMNFWFGEPGGVAWLIVLIVVPLMALAAPFLVNMRKKAVDPSLS